MTSLRSALRAEIVLRERMAAAIPLPAAAHEILLHVALAHVEGRRISVSAVTIGAPVTTRRHVVLLVEAGLIRREPDGYRVWLYVTDEGFARVAALFDQAQAVAA